MTMTGPNYQEQTKYGELVAEVEGSFYFLDYTFKYREDFSGATGSVMRPVPREEYEERTERENVIDYLREIWQQGVAEGEIESSLEDWADSAIDADGVDQIMFDESYAHQYGPALRDIGYSEEDYPIIECEGGGRCFGHDQEWTRVFRPDLLEVIAAYEN